MKSDAFIDRYTPLHDITFIIKKGIINSISCLVFDFYVFWGVIYVHYISPFFKELSRSGWRNLAIIYCCIAYESAHLRSVFYSYLLDINKMNLSILFFCLLISFFNRTSCLVFRSRMLISSPICIKIVTLLDM